MSNQTKFVCYWPDLLKDILRFAAFSHVIIYDIVPLSLGVTHKHVPLVHLVKLLLDNGLSCTELSRPFPMVAQKENHIPFRWMDTKYVTYTN